ncbi:MAG TPA: NAD(P) transhydrogenase subunit alpha [Candidatus Marinimicrobia bacterium]|jgi:NAD(P) transhydrogenase subunit alpha|nr:NAD(P) transhydrogenase subunit alpha [Candidatus Neomarinimicrobiota bacterium]MDP6142630.1 NAD(P) transhydrogenase subunit alpha [Candidatus Neomarinimicrobiota bacterium]MDP6261114.1 NAD(P) transhydrogenase subunit alpha [Candidatus Neomarinimicrobiota bacterium]MDP7127156.1 NAD(P) transhydrogenase subunit alpha [Candidatus Neomarinimicrobiota bacterium]MDP7336554.1 NAD(P) transhydrogenase subunit alpha [Candidatus Neomarinimicrobiota bacterium]|tara:strand:+ start:267 stop:545 length:279 start_codon:yes stop_codon:yes gene_type:complete
MELIILLFIAVLATFAGGELIGKVPPQLHTPLMSGSNAISGITIVGALIAVGASGNDTLLAIIGFCAIVFGTINVVGGYLVTDRMLKMFKKK